jgi:hypothetical protein
MKIAVSTVEIDLNIVTIAKGSKFKKKSKGELQYVQKPEVTKL